MKRLFLILAAAPLCAQNFNVVRIIPNGTRTAVGQAQFYNSAQTFYVGLQAPSLSANISFTLPSADGSSGQCLTTNGSAVLTFTSCAGLTPPATLTQSASTATLTLQNSGSGYALHVASGTAGSLFSSPVVLDATNPLTVGGNTYVYGTFGVGGTSTFSGSLAGTHAQNVGTGDGPTFASVTTTAGLVVGGAASVGGNLTAASTSIGGNLLVTGTLSGSHLQNVGSGDSPSFAGLSASGLISAATLSATALIATGVAGGTGGFSSNGSTGLSCSGSPSSSFASVLGIVTHC